MSIVSFEDIKDFMNLSQSTVDDYPKLKGILIKYATSF